MRLWSRNYNFHMHCRDYYHAYFQCYRDIVMVITKCHSLMINFVYRISSMSHFPCWFALGNIHTYLNFKLFFDTETSRFVAIPLKNWYNIALNIMAADDMGTPGGRASATSMAFTRNMTGLIQLGPVFDKDMKGSMLVTKPSLVSVSLSPLASRFP